MAKNEILHAKIGWNLDFLYTLELHISKESLECVQCKFKKKKYDYLKEKNSLWKFLILTLWWQNYQKQNFPNCSGFFHGQIICRNLFLNTNLITKIPLIIIEEQKKVFKNLSKCVEKKFFHTLGKLF